MQRIGLILYKHRFNFVVNRFNFVNMEREQFVKVPNETLDDKDLEMRDKLIYAYLKKHYNHKTNDSFPSLDTLVKESGISKPTVIKCISNLEKAGYISVSKVKKVNHYTFSEIHKFEIYSFDFLDDPTLSMSDKAYLVSMQRYMRKHKEFGSGLVAYSDLEIAEKLGIDLRTLKKYENHLMENDRPILTMVPTAKKDPETGLAIEERIFDFDAYNNILALKFKKVDDDIEELKKENEILKRELRKIQIQLNTTEVQPIEL